MLYLMLYPVSITYYLAFNSININLIKTYEKYMHRFLNDTFHFCLQ